MNEKVNKIISTNRNDNFNNIKAASSRYRFQFFGHVILRMLIFKVLFVRFRIRHLSLTNDTHMDECFLCSFFLFVCIVTLLLFHFSSFVGGFRLRLQFLVSSCHRAYPKWQRLGNKISLQKVNLKRKQLLNDIETQYDYSYSLILHQIVCWHEWHTQQPAKR